MIMHSNSFICDVTWRIRIWRDVTHSYMTWRDSFIHDATWLILTWRDRTHSYDMQAHEQSASLPNLWLSATPFLFSFHNTQSYRVSVKWVKSRYTYRRHIMYKCVVVPFTYKYTFTCKCSLPNVWLSAMFHSYNTCRIHMAHTEQLVCLTCG